MISDFAFLGFGPLMSTVVILVLLIIFAFEIWMFVSAITNKVIAGTAKIWWIVGMVLIHPIVAIIYYFTDYKKEGR
ncbi:MAG TPA: hypothetical protein VFH99_02735 [Candidatus Saccharimonadales bacterium]|nr:hypothetical protein [Candidatus Saccharimonadales bacterium]